MPPLKNGKVAVLEGPRSSAGGPNHTVTFNNSLSANYPLFSTFAIDDGAGDPEQYEQTNTTTYQTPFDLDDGTSIPSKISLLGLLRTTPESGIAEDAHLCALSFCARRFNTTMDRTTLSSQVVDTSYSSIGPNSSYAFLSGNETLHYTSNDGTADMLLFETVFSRFLRTIIQGNLIGSPGGFEGKAIVPSATNQLMFAFSNSEDIPATMDNIAAAITNRMRALSNVTVAGQAGSIEQYIETSWVWLALPALMIAAGIVVLILAMMETKKHGLHVWKTSEMALLFHGLDPPIPQAAGVNSASEMEAWSKDVKVKLVQDSKDHVTLRRSNIIPWP